MNFVRLEGNDGPTIIKPTLYTDSRGYFFESFNESQLKDVIGDVKFVQDNESCSSYGVIRGLHFQNPPYAQAKLVRVVSGAVFDVAVDIRKNSPTYGKWYGAYLSQENHYQFFIPRGYAHGFVSLRDNTVFQYKCDNFYNKESEGSIFILDSEIGIDWTNWVRYSDMILSDKDRAAKLFNELDSKFVYEG